MPSARYHPGNATCDLTVMRAGVLLLTGHDLGMRVTRFQIDVSDTGTGLSVEGRFDARSLMVAGALEELTGDPPGPPVLSPREVAQIEALVRHEVLLSDRHPEILFSSKGAPMTCDTHTLDGQVTIRGVTRPIQVDLVRVRGDLLGRARIHQHDFGIRPYRSFWRALEVDPDVTVDLRVTP